jgi:hypothetical protein
VLLKPSQDMSGAAAAACLPSAYTDCLAMPHTIHLVVVVFAALLFIQSVLEVVSTALQLCTSSCQQCFELHSIVSCCSCLKPKQLRHSQLERNLFAVLLLCSLWACVIRTL